MDTYERILDYFTTHPIFCSMCLTLSRPALLKLGIEERATPGALAFLLSLNQIEFVFDLFDPNLLAIADEAAKGSAADAIADCTEVDYDRISAEAIQYFLNEYIVAQIVEDKNPYDMDFSFLSVVENGVLQISNLKLIHPMSYALN